MNLVLAVLTDGRRDCIERTIPSLEEMVTSPIARRLIFDDSGDPDNALWLRQRFQSYAVHEARVRLGYSGAVARALDELTGRAQDWAFVTEDDFVFHEPIDLEAMRVVMDANEQVAQMVLPRQPWYPRERRAGGILEVWPGQWTTIEEVGGPMWREHRLFWSMNPHLIRTQFIEDHPWPREYRSERKMGRRVFRDPETTVGLWGGPGAEFVEHIGVERVGTGY